MPRPREYDDELRARLLDSASRLLAAEGPHALSTRRIAAEVGTSTTAIYTLIGSKEELIREMFNEGFRRFAAHLDSVPENPDPIAHLADLGEAYLANAFENPSLYLVMFSRPMSEFAPSEEDAIRALSTLQVLIDAVQRCVDAGIFHGSAEDLAVELWALEHGIVSLVISGMLDEDRARQLYAHAAAATAIGIMTGAALPPTREDEPDEPPTARHAINPRVGVPD